MKPAQIYVYPYSSKVPPENDNPYIKNLMHGLNHSARVINHQKPNKYGIADIVRKINGIDAIILNWIENLPDKKWGVIQSFLIMWIIHYLKFRNRQVIWIMHNKLSHSQSNTFWKKRLFSFMVKYSTMIITHSSEGLKYLKRYGKANKLNSFFYPHPVDRKYEEHTHLTYNRQYEYDIIIWGTISPYKGIDQFLKNLHISNSIDRYRILIVGKFSSDTYYSNIENLCGIHTFLRNEYLEFSELEKLIRQSKIILFPYKPESVLSSGALMDSLRYPSMIIGPDVGAFSDLSEIGLIETFGSYNELVSTIDEALQQFPSNVPINKRRAFIEENSWKNYTACISHLIQHPTSRIQ